MSLRVLGVAGSLRRGSFNRALLRAATELAPDGMAITIFDGLAAIPPYNADVEAEGDPPPVAAWKSAIAAADALLIATPEYNYSVPGVLKNAIDWASRPPGKSVLNGKPAGLMGATPGATGTTRAQLALRQSFVFTNTCALLQPEVLIARVHEKIDAAGRVTDAATRELVAQLLAAFAGWVPRVGTAAGATGAS
jgi:chromate reductase, NAD(P)H dehydrogenase (quinone)